LVQQFGDLEGLYARIGEIARENLREKIVAGREAAFLSRELASLKRDVPLDVHAWAFTPTLAQAARYLEETLEFRTLGKRLRERAAKHSAAAAAPVFTAPTAGQTWGPYEAVTTAAKWHAWREKLKAAKVFAFDTETTSLNPRQARLVGVSFAISQNNQSNEAYYIPIAPLAEDVPSQTGDLFAPEKVSGPHGVEGLDLRGDLRALLADPTLTLVGHNLKYDAHIVEAYCGATIGAEGAARFEDTLLMAQTMLPPQGGFGLDNLAKTLLGHTMIPYTEVAGKGKTQVTFDAVALDVATTYAAEDADATLRLYRHLGALPASKVYEDIERPLLPVLVEMERTGVCIDAAYLRELSSTMAIDLATREAEIHALAGHSFNVQSTQQLAVVLFDELGAGSEKQKKARSTAVDVLESLAELEGPAQKIA